MTFMRAVRAVEGVAAEAPNDSRSGSIRARVGRAKAIFWAQRSHRQLNGPAMYARGPHPCTATESSSETNQVL